MPRPNYSYRYVIVRETVQPFGPAKRKNTGSDACSNSKRQRIRAGAAYRLIAFLLHYARGRREKRGRRARHARRDSLLLETLSNGAT